MTAEDIDADELGVYLKQSEDSTSLPWNNGIEKLDPGETPLSEETTPFLIG